MIQIKQGETLKIERTISNLESLSGAVAFLSMTDMTGVTTYKECDIDELTVSVELEPSETQTPMQYALEIKVWLNGEADSIMEDVLYIKKSAMPLQPTI